MPDTKDGPDLFITFTSKPLSVAAQEHLPAVQVAINLSEPPVFAGLIDEAVRLLEGQHAAD
jgi:hypothetical protein